MSNKKWVEFNGSEYECASTVKFSNDIRKMKGFHDQIVEALCKNDVKLAAELIDEFITTYEMSDLNNPDGIIIIDKSIPKLRCWKNILGPLMYEQRKNVNATITAARQGKQADQIVDAIRTIAECIAITVGCKQLTGKLRISLPNITITGNNRISIADITNEQMLNSVMINNDIYYYSTTPIPKDAIEKYAQTIKTLISNAINNNTRMQLKDMLSDLHEETGWFYDISE